MPASTSPSGDWGEHPPLQCVHRRAAYWVCQEKLGHRREPGGLHVGGEVECHLSPDESAAFPGWSVVSGTVSVGRRWRWPRGGLELRVCDEHAGAAQLQGLRG